MTATLYSCRCRSCGWLGERPKAGMRKPCPECGSYPLKTDARPLKPAVPFSNDITLGVRIESMHPFLGTRIYTSTNRSRDDQITVSIINPRTRKSRRMTVLRLAACIRFGRDLPATYGVFPRDGNRNNCDPANTFVFPHRRVHEAFDRLKLGFDRECAICGETFKARKKSGEICSPECRKVLKRESERDRRLENKKREARERAAAQV